MSDTPVALYDHRNGNTIGLFCSLYCVCRYIYVNRVTRKPRSKRWPTYGWKVIENSLGFTVVVKPCSMAQIKELRSMPYIIYPPYEKPKKMIKTVKFTHFDGEGIVSLKIGDNVVAKRKYGSTKMREEICRAWYHIYVYPHHEKYIFHTEITKS